MANRFESIAFRDMDILWKKYFRDPSAWYDIRNTKNNFRSPDFKNKKIKESLWISGWYNPFWVCEELRRREFILFGMEVKLNDLCENSQNKGHCIAAVASLKACTRNKDLHKGSIIHADILKQGLVEKSPYVGSTLVSMYAKCGALTRARQVLEALPVRNVFSWSALITGYVQYGHGEEALKCFQKMLQEGLSPDSVTYVCALNACTLIGALDKGQQFHNEIIRKGILRTDIAVGNSLVDMYAKCGALGKAQELLNKLPSRDVVSWCTLIAGFTQFGLCDEALDCFEQLPFDGLSANEITFVCVLKACGSTRALNKGKQFHNEILVRGLMRKSIVLSNALVNMYAKCDALAEANHSHNQLCVRDVVSWSALIATYIRQGHSENALECFNKMQSEGIYPDAITFTSLLKACSRSKAIEKGRDIHCVILDKGLLKQDAALGTALISMYAKCGAFVKAQQVLEELPVRNVTSWNALISGYIGQGKDREVMNCFRQMEHDGIIPNAITYTSMLYASRD